MRSRGDDGQLMLLMAFFALFAALLVVVVVDASAAFLAHRELAGVADGAALAAAQSVDTDAYYAGGAGGGALPLGDVEAVAASYVAAAAPDAEVTAVTLVDGGRAVRVSLRRRIRFALAAAVFPDGTEIGAEATARLALR